MQRGESCKVFGDKFDAEKPSVRVIGRGKRAYLWIGGVGGPCYAVLSDPVQMRRLADQILKRLGAP